MSVCQHFRTLSHDFSSFVSNAFILCKLRIYVFGGHFHSCAQISGSVVVPMC